MGSEMCIRDRSLVTLAEALVESDVVVLSCPSDDYESFVYASELYEQSEEEAQGLKGLQKGVSDGDALTPSPMCQRVCGEPGCDRRCGDPREDHHPCRCENIVEDWKGPK